jgi:hypothetical protein
MLLSLNAMVVSLDLQHNNNPCWHENTDLAPLCEISLVFVLFLLLQDSLDGYKETEFWYVDRGIVLAERDSRRGGSPKLYLQRQEEKWWLPTPKVPVNGLSEEARRKLQHQRESMNQILKAAMAINGQVLSEMEVPQVYLDSLPKVSWLASISTPVRAHPSPGIQLWDFFSCMCVVSMWCQSEPTATSAS